MILNREFLYSRCILCVTSVWIVIPFSESFMKRNYVFSLLLLLTMGFSMLHWRYYKHNDFLHNADRLTSCSCLLYCIYTNPLLLTIVPFLLVFLKGGYESLKHSQYTLHLIQHLIFRYFAFWMCCYTSGMVIDFTTIIAYSLVYIASIICTYLIVIDD